MTRQYSTQAVLDERKDTDMDINAKTLSVGAALAVVIGGATYFGLQQALTPKAEISITVNGQEADGAQAELNFEKASYDILCREAPDTPECQEQAQRIEELKAKLP